MRIQKTVLAQKLNQIKGVVSKNTTMPILQGVLVKDGYLIASNLEMTIRAKIPGANEECFIIPERAFDLINNLPEGSELTLKAEMLLKSIKRVSYAIPTQVSDPRMSSMLMQAKDGQLNFVGLDGHVLAWDKIKYDGEFELLISKSTIEKLKPVLLTGDVKIKYSDSMAIFSTEDFDICTRIVQGKYYPYRDMFKELPINTFVVRSELLGAMVRAKMCTAEKSPVKFELSGNKLNLSIKDQTTDYHEVIDLLEDVTENLKIGFDAKLVIETLKAFDCEHVKISLHSSKMPMVIEANDSEFRAMVLPIALN